MSDFGPYSLNGKNAAVTGAAMGIGMGIANRLAEAGANVLIADMNLDAATKTAADLAAKHGTKVVAVKLDVTADNAGDQLVAETVKAFGSIDILVNNAGIYPTKSMLEMDYALWDKTLTVNLRGLAFISKAVANQMIKQGGGGAMVNIASIDGIHPSFPGLAAYDASKGGVVMFTKNFALELGAKGIRVNAIAPGGIKTPGAGGDAIGIDVEAPFVPHIPLGRMGQPDDIGKVAAFLASDAAGYITGEAVVLDGRSLIASR